mmetsp:Transcript_12273/g.40299  ORF Transcript_12273/g.40299 Transcript_12273/m.40299 type:complete len:224 (+) Transcript_12273:37-708(+)
MEFISRIVSALGGEESSSSSNGPLTEAQILRFFQAWKAVATSSDMTAYLREIWTRTKSEADVQVAIDASQKSVFLEIGVDGDFGMGELGRIVRVHKNNPAVMGPFAQHVQLEESLHDAASLSEEEIKAKQQMAEAQIQTMAAMQQLPPEQRERVMRAQLQAQQEAMAAFREETQLDPSRPENQPAFMRWAQARMQQMAMRAPGESAFAPDAGSGPPSSMSMSR